MSIEWIAIEVEAEAEVEIGTEEVEIKAGVGAEAAIIEELKSKTLITTNLPIHSQQIHRSNLPSFYFLFNFIFFIIFLF